MTSRFVPILVAGCLVAGCDQCGGRSEAKDAAPADAAPAPRDAATDGASPPADASRPLVDASISAPTDAGPSLCRLAFGPAEQPFHGPAALTTASTELRLVANEDGRPRVYPLPIGITGHPPPVPDSIPTMRWPPCEIAGRWAYCQARGGSVTRTTLGAADTKEVAKSRAGTRIAAAPLGSDHAVVAFLDLRKTTEGEMLQAFAVLDDGDPVRLSDEGAGATLVHLAPRGDAAVAVYLDARSGMAPVHARPVSARGRELALGADTVLHISGPPERGIDFALAGPPGGLFALLPTTRDITDFGMSTIPVHDPPQSDVTPSWSLYPNGLDPAPIAARGSYIARVRPDGKGPASPRVIELGRLDDKGTFTSLGAITDARTVSYVAITTDPSGAVWILYAEPEATWLERRVCP